MADRFRLIKLQIYIIFFFFDKTNIYNLASQKVLKNWRKYERTNFIIERIIYSYYIYISIFLFMHKESELTTLHALYLRSIKFYKAFEI